MKKIVEISQLNGNLLGVSMHRFDATFVQGAMDTIGKAHKNDHYVWLLLESGRAELLVDFKKVALNAWTSALLFPEQVKHLSSYGNGKGWALFFDRTMINHQFSLAFEESPYQLFSFELEEDQGKWFRSGFELLHTTIATERPMAFHRFTVESLLSALLYQLSSIHDSKRRLDSVDVTSRRMEITRAFRRLLRQNYVRRKAPHEYAKLMNISVGYLNDSVKMVTGQSVTTWIQETMVREAQRLLYHSTLSIKEIAVQMGFDDPQYFNRIFSKVTDQSPGDFRKNIFNQLENRGTDGNL